MDDATAYLLTRPGMGDAPADLQLKLVAKFLALLLESAECPRWLLFYTDGVRLTCEGSPVLAQLRALEERGSELVLCQTCLDYFGLGDQVTVGSPGGMPAIVEAMRQASKVIAV